MGNNEARFFNSSCPMEQGQLIRGGGNMKFYTIKLPKFIGGFVKACLGAFRKE